MTLLGGFGTVCSNGDNPEPEVEQMCFNADQFSQPEIATGLPAAAQINQDGWPDFQPAIQIIRVRRQVSAASWSERGCRSAGDRFIGRIGGGSFVWEEMQKRSALCCHCFAIPWKNTFIQMRPLDPASFCRWHRFLTSGTGIKTRTNLELLGRTPLYRFLADTAG